MKQPKIAKIPLVEDLNNPSGHSQLRDLAELEKQGKIKIWPDGIKYSNGWVIVVYDEVGAQ